MLPWHWWWPRLLLLIPAMAAVASNAAVAVEGQECPPRAIESPIFYLTILLAAVAILGILSYFESREHAKKQETQQNIPGPQFVIVHDGEPRARRRKQQGSYYSRVKGHNK